MMTVMRGEVPLPDSVLWTVLHVLTETEKNVATTGCVTGPAGSMTWLVNGLRHRDDGPAAICYVSNTAEYWQHGVLLSREPLATDM